MAVYERTYTRYTGPTTPESSRFLVLARDALRDLFSSKLVTALFAFCFLYTVWSVLIINVRHSATLLEMFPDFDLGQLIEIDRSFFSVYLRVQSVFAFFLALVVGPGLISRDLVNNGLPLYLSRPFSRFQYLLGRFTVLAGLLSTITWIPCLLLIAIQSSFVPDWLGENLVVVLGAVAYSAVLITAYGLLAMAASAWLRWRPVAAFAMALVAVSGVFFAGMVKVLFDADFGKAFSLVHLLWELVPWLLQVPDAEHAISLLLLLFALAAFGALCTGLLVLKVRAYEVVR